MPEVGEVLSEARPEDRSAVEESLARLTPRVALLQVSSDPRSQAAAIVARGFGAGNDIGLLREAGGQHPAQHQKVGPEPDMQMSDQVLAKAVHAIHVVLVFQYLDPPQIVRQFRAPLDQQERRLPQALGVAEFVENVGPRFGDFADDQRGAFDEIVDLHQQFLAGAQHLIGAQTGKPKLLLDNIMDDLKKCAVLIYLRVCVFVRHDDEHIRSSVRGLKNRFWNIWHRSDPHTVAKGLGFLDALSLEHPHSMDGYYTTASCCTAAR